MIEAENLTKRYDRFLAVDNVSFSVKKGEIYGFLGPNGAGKTTTIKMLIGLLTPSAGRVRICGYDLAENPLDAKGAVGFVPDSPFIYEKLTGSEFLGFIAGIYKVKAEAFERRSAELLEFFELTDWKDELTESYSHGMKQRLVMAGALLHRPRVFIVDEPLVGLDPKGARLLKMVFKRLSSEGVSIFMSTHSLDVAEELCGRIAIIQNGRILAEGTTEELRERAAGGDDESLEAIFLKLTGGDDLSAAQELLRD